jgi:hypothetical protein
MTDALYVSMFTAAQSSMSERKRRLKAKVVERLARFGIYGATVTAFALQSPDPSLYAGIASSICLALECLR